MGILDWIKDYWKDIRKSTGKTFKNIVLTAHFWVLLVAVGLMIAMGIIIFNLLDARSDQRMADYWQNNSETSYRQISVFSKTEKIGDKVPLYQDVEGNALSRDSIKDMRKALQGTVDSGKKTVASETKEVKPKGWEDCFSTQFMADVNYTKSQVVDSSEIERDMNTTAEVVAVGGNFTAFHPFEYMSGGFLPADVDGSEYENLIVVNDNLAWEMFKSYDVTGEKISLWDKDFVICGVIREKKTDVDKITGSDKNRVFCYFSVVEELNKNNYFSENPEGPVKTIAITCYEVMLPEAVKGVARSDVLAALPSYNAEDPMQLIVSNTGRFRVDKVYEHNIPVGKVEHDTADYQFPYWEKASILTYERLFVVEAVCLFAIVLFFIGIILVALRVRRSRLEPKVVEEDKDEEEVSIQDSIQMS